MGDSDSKMVIPICRRMLQFFCRKLAKHTDHNIDRRWILHIYLELYGIGAYMIKMVKTITHRKAVNYLFF
jgi:hypothetical protein